MVVKCCLNQDNTWLARIKNNMGGSRPNPPPCKIQISLKYIIKLPTIWLGIPCQTQITVGPWVYKQDLNSFVHAVKTTKFKNIWNESEFIHWMVYYLIFKKYINSTRLHAFWKILPRHFKCLYTNMPNIDSVQFTCNWYHVVFLTLIEFSIQFNLKCSWGSFW